MYQAVLYLLLLAALSPVWWAAGQLAARLKAPRITGYILAGVASGPYALGALSAEGLEVLSPVDRLSLSLIALAAGAELQLAELRKIKRQVTWITLGISGCTWVLVFPCALALASYLPFMAAVPPHTVTAMATLLATLAVARSPASAIAVLKETEGKGPYCSLVMAVVVLKDVLVFVCFALNIELAKAASKAEQSMSVSHLLEPLGSIIISTILGAAAGYVLSAMRQPQLAGARLNPIPRMLPPSVRARLRPAAPLAVSGCTFFLAEALRGEPLLACVTAGLVLANIKFGPASEEAMELLAGDVSRLMPTVNVAFFGLAAVRDSLWAAAVLFLVRLAGIWLGCAGGAKLGGTPEAVGSRVWMGMITQAGVALGLARIVTRNFPDWGPDFSALAAGMVLMNLFTGPPMFKAAVIAAGEARAIALPVLATEFDTRMKRDPSHQALPIPQIPIINVLGQSVGAGGVLQSGAGALVAAGATLKNQLLTELALTNSGSRDMD